MRQRNTDWPRVILISWIGIWLLAAGFCCVNTFMSDPPAPPVWFGRMILCFLILAASLIAVFLFSAMADAWWGDE